MWLIPVSVPAALAAGAPHNLAWADFLHLLFGPLHLPGVRGEGASADEVLKSAV